MECQSKIYISGYKVRFVRKSIKTINLSMWDEGMVKYFCSKRKRLRHSI